MYFLARSIARWFPLLAILSGLASAQHAYGEQKPSASSCKICEHIGNIRENWSGRTQSATSPDNGQSQELEALGIHATEVMFPSKNGYVLRIDKISPDGIVANARAVGADDIRIKEGDYLSIGEIYTSYSGLGAAEFSRTHGSQKEFHDFLLRIRDPSYKPAAGYRGIRAQVSRLKTSKEPLDISSDDEVEFFETAFILDLPHARREPSTESATITPTARPDGTTASHEKQLALDSHKGFRPKFADGIIDDRFDPSRSALSQILEYAELLSVEKREISSALWYGKLTPHREDLERVRREVIEAKAPKVGLQQCTGGPYFPSNYCESSFNCGVLEKNGYSNCNSTQFEWDSWKEEFGIVPQWVAFGAGYLGDCDSTGGTKPSYCVDRKKTQDVGPPLFGTDYPDPMSLDADGMKAVEQSQSYFSGAAAWIALRDGPQPARGIHQPTGRTLLYDRIRQSVFMPYLAKRMGTSLQADVPPKDSNELDMPDISGLPSEHGRTLAAIYSGKRVQFTNESMLFVAGLAEDLLTRCSLPSNASQQQVISGFIKSAAVFVSGRREAPGSDVDFGEVAAARMKEVGSMTRGKAFGSSLACDTPHAQKLASGLASTLRANEKGPTGGPSTFMAGCSQSMPADKCECLAKNAEAVVPNIHQNIYSREVLHNIATSNPIVGMQIVMTCGIVNY